MHEWKVMCLNPAVVLFSILIFFSFPLFPSHHFRFFSPLLSFFSLLLSIFPLQACSATSMLEHFTSCGGHDSERHTGNLVSACGGEVACFLGLAIAIRFTS